MTLTRKSALSTALVAAIGFAAAPQPAHALSDGAAVGIGLGALAVGTAIGAGATPYYGYPGYYGYYGYPAYYSYAPYPAYYSYAPYPAYAPRSCWSPYYRTYVAC